MDQNESGHQFTNDIVKHFACEAALGQQIIAIKHTQASVGGIKQEFTRA